MAAGVLVTAMSFFLPRARPRSSGLSTCCDSRKIPTPDSSGIYVEITRYKVLTRDKTGFFAKVIVNCNGETC